MKNSFQELQAKKEQESHTAFICKASTVRVFNAIRKCNPVTRKCINLVKYTFYEAVDGEKFQTKGTKTILSPIT